MNEELYERMKQYESYFHTAFYSDYTRGVTRSQLEDLISIGAVLGVRTSNKSCPKCNFDFIKRLAKIYYDYEKESIKNRREEVCDTSGDSQRKEVQQNKRRTKQRVGSESEAGG